MAIAQITDARQRKILNHQDNAAYRNINPGSADIPKSESSSDANENDYSSFYVGNIRTNVSYQVVKSFFTRNGISVKYLKLIFSNKEMYGNGAKIVITKLSEDKFKSLKLPESIYTRTWYERKREINNNYAR